MKNIVKICKLTALLTVITLCLTFAASCTPVTPTGPVDTSNFTQQIKRTSNYFGTVSTLILLDDYTKPGTLAKLEKTWEEVKNILGRVENALSANIADSDIDRFNQLKTGESIKVSEITAKAILTAKKAYELTDGLYDPTVYSLVDLWGFTPRFTGYVYTPEKIYDRERLEDGGFAMPPNEYLDKFTRLCDFSKVELTGNSKKGYTLTKRAEGVVIGGVMYYQKLDLGGTGKGLAVDMVYEYLKSQGYEYGYFTSGGSSARALKLASPEKYTQEDDPEKWTIGSEQPRFGLREEIYISFWLNNISLATSGDYERCYTVNNILYSHIISPKTGYPMNTYAGISGEQSGVCIVTLLLENGAAFADTLTTAMCNMTPQQLIEFINSGKIEGKFYVSFVIYNNQYDYCEVVTNAKPGEFRLEAEEKYVLASELDENGKVVYTGNLWK